jgi:transcriptional regulator GlxA family with amidase domain
MLAPRPTALVGATDSPTSSLVSALCADDYDGRAAPRRADLDGRRPDTIAQRQELYRAAQAIVASEYASDLLIGEVARRVYASPRQLQRVYREQGDTTFRTALGRVRVEEAARLLAGTTMTVREIARRVGYHQPAQFAKAFRRRFGVAPAEYRSRVLRGRR